MSRTNTDPAGRVRERMQRWLDTTQMGQRAFAKDLHKSQVWLQKILKGANQVRLRDLDAIAQAMRCSAAELVRDTSERHTADLTSTEILVLERLRHRPRILQAVLSILDVKEDTEFAPRVPKSPTPKRSGPRPI